MKKIIILILVLGFVATASADFCTVGWTSLTGFTGIRYRGGGGAWDGLFYIYGGQWNSTPYLNDTQIYDPELDSWSYGANMPTAKFNFGSAVVDGKAFAIGGSDGTITINETAIYDIGGDTWSTGAVYPATATGVICADGGNGLLYCFGGTIDGSNALTSAYSYDPVGDAWTPLTAMTAAKMYGAAAGMNGKIYIAGGWEQITGGDAVTLEYDIEGDSYTTLASPTGRHGPAFAAAGDMLWLTAGGTWWTELNTADQYFIDDAWTAATTITNKRVSPAFGYLPGYGLFVAGGTWSGSISGSIDLQLWNICVPGFAGVDPDSGPAETAVTITGEMFQSDAVPVLFDGTKADYPLENVTVVSDTEITGDVPAGIPDGTYSLRITNSLGQMSEFADAFTVEEAADDDTADDDTADDDTADDDTTDDDVVDDDAADDDAADDDAADDDAADDDATDDDDLGDDDTADDDNDDNDSGGCGC